MKRHVTVIVPTRNEAGNVPELTRRLAEVLPCDGSHELLFVDDSDDDTPAVVRSVSTRSALPVRLLHRPRSQRSGGLGGAVVAGLRSSSSELVVVMDGDLQHPPPTVPQLLDSLGASDVAVASRYCSGGTSSGLAGFGRRLASNASTVVAKLLFPRRLHGCSDPMTGFFAFRRAAVDVDELQPRGFKILLEILVRRRLRVREIPFTFEDRFDGRSKADLRQGALYVRHLLGLRLGRMAGFALVGLTGFCLNLLLMAVVLQAGGHYVLASAVATELTIASNFLLQERFVFHDRRGSTAWSRRALTSLLYNNVDYAIRVPALVVLVSVVGVHELAAQALTIAASFAARFTFTSRVVYRVRTAAPLPTPWRAPRATAVPRPRPAAEVSTAGMGMEAI